MFCLIRKDKKISQDTFSITTFDYVLNDIRTSMEFNTDDDTNYRFQDRNKFLPPK